jgi:hypothetical protein
VNASAEAGFRQGRLVLENGHYSRGNLRYAGLLLGACIIILLIGSSARAREGGIAGLHRSRSGFHCTAKELLSNGTHETGICHWVPIDIFPEFPGNVVKFGTGLAPETESPRRTPVATVSVRNHAQFRSNGGSFGKGTSAQENQHPEAKEASGPKRFAHELEGMSDVGDSMTAEEVFVKALKIMDEAILQKLN